MRDYTYIKYLLDKNIQLVYKIERLWQENPHFLFFTGYINKVEVEV